MLLCTGSLLNVYSTATSLLVRRIETNNGSVVGMKISPSNPDTVYVAHACGVIQLWNWVEGEMLMKVQDDVTIYGIDVTISKSSPIETIFYIGRPNGEETTTSVYKFSATSQKPSAISLLHSIPTILRHIQVLNSGSLVLAIADRTVVAGVSNSAKHGTDPSKEQDSKSLYRWNVMEFPEGLGCFDARELSNPAQKKANAHPNIVAVAFGTILGKIYVYDDIVKAMQDPSAQKFRLMHWHRNRIGAIKWSQDGMLHMYSLGSSKIFRKLHYIWW
jgi:NET1-associated nuclear protein 1 (U3 small nucleolar RNA-associated protein 17)